MPYNLLPYALPSQTPILEVTIFKFDWKCNTMERFFIWFLPIMHRCFKSLIPLQQEWIFLVLINLCQSMRSTKKHFVLSLSALSRNTECIYFLSFSAVLQTELPKLENLPELDNSHRTSFGGVCTFCSSLQSHRPAESFWIPVSFLGVTPVKIHSLKHWRVSQAPISSTCWSPR